MSVYEYYSIRHSVRHGGSEFYKYILCLHLNETLKRVQSDNCDAECAYSYYETLICSGGKGTNEQQQKSKEKNKIYFPLCFPPH